jgi:hypothetical protein
VVNHVATDYSNKICKLISKDTSPSEIHILYIFFAQSASDKHIIGKSIFPFSHPSLCPHVSALKTLTGFQADLAFCVHTEVTEKI